MKKLLPKSALNPKGFTLIELMVTITIISVLAVVGVVAYSGVSARARDAKRIAEIDAIHKAMEKKYAAGTGYVVLADSDFANNVIPTDPMTGQTKCGAGGAQVCGYCAFAAGTTPANYANCGGATNPNIVSTSRPAASNVGYVVCANLETGAGLSGTTYYCKANAQ